MTRTASKLWLFLVAGFASSPFASALPQQQVMKVPKVNSVNNGQAGWSLVWKGDTTVIGAPRAYSHLGTASGVVGIFDSNGVQVHSGGTATSFGHSVDIDGDLMVMGDPSDNFGGASSGAVYAFSRQGSIWYGPEKIKASDGVAQDAFGTSVAIVGNVLLVGSPMADTGSVDRGAVYSFYRSGNSWVQEQKLVPSTLSGTNFGAALSRQGDTVAVGAPAGAGAIYLATRQGAFPFATWSIQAELQASDGPGGQFGKAVAMQGDRIVAGAPHDDDNGSQSGAAYVFQRVLGQWSETAKLSAWNPAAGAHFGFSVAFDGPVIAVGAPDANATAGVAYPFKLTTAGWQPLRTLTHSCGSSTYFGYSIAVQGNKVLVGAMGAMAFPSAAHVKGAACLFDLDQLEPNTYCVAKVNSAGCTPRIGFDGYASQSFSNSFRVNATQVLNNKPGTLLWGLAPLSIPFQGGTLCINPPITRTVGQSTAGGTPPPAIDCTGRYSYLFSNAYMASKGLSYGATVYCQYWSRDPGFPVPESSGLTDGLMFVIGP